jgi:hypothetical protein
MTKLNPNAKLVYESAKKANEAARKHRQDALNAKRGISKSLNADQHKVRNDRKRSSKKFFKDVMARMDEAS